MNRETDPLAPHLARPTVLVRPAAARGHADHGWLRSAHTFSFADYHDPAFMGFRALRVINEDRVAPGRGFGTHSHRDMEILSYVLRGAIAHEDSMGNGEVLRPGEVQRMTAGTGVTHSEFNPSTDEPLHFLQIWITPERRGLPPSYQQTAFPMAERRGRLRPVASRDGADGALTVHQDVVIYAGLLADGEATTLELAPGRHAWIQIARGSIVVDVDGERQALAAGDGVAISGAPRVGLVGAGDELAELLGFDLA